MSAFKKIAERFIVRGKSKPPPGLGLSFDLEANGLLDVATEVHCIGITDLYNDDPPAEYGPDKIDAALRHLGRASYLVGHNICGYDLVLLKQLYGWEPARGCAVLDTLIAGRLILPNISTIDDEVAAIEKKSLGKLRGRYSIEAWGERLGEPKVGTGIEDWSKWTPEMQARCVSDTKLSKKIWQFLEPESYNKNAVELEHQVSQVCDRITSDGIPFDVKAAKKLSKLWVARQNELEVHLAKEFPGINFNSRMQIGELLEDKGWKPAKRTKETKRPKIDDEALEDIGKLYPEMQGLAEYLVIGRRLGQLINGKEAWINHVDDRGYIHGSVVHIGTPHSRAAHFNPNLAQVPNNKRGKPLSAECRALFHHASDWVFVACDQAGLQDRCFSHYLASFDGGAYGRSFVSGSDTHWASTIALGLVPPGTERDKNSKLHGVLREGSKSFRYGFLFGMRAKRAAEIISGTLRAAHAINPEYVGPKVDGQHALNQFEAATPGLKELREKLDQLAGSNQWVLGLDGRRVPTGAQYKALNRIVTSAEAIICKRWLVRVHNELRRRFTYGWDGDVVITAWVHDELVCCCRPEIADEVGQIMVDFAKEAGEAYRLKVPLDASYAIGRNWAGDPVAERGPGRARKALTEPVRTEEPADIEGGSIMHVRAAKKSNAEPNHDEAERFLRLLDPDEDRFTFQTFDDDVERRDTRAKELAKVNAERAAKGLKPRKKHDPFAGIYHGTLEENWKTLYRLNNEGAGIYITVNATDFKGRSEENIQRVRALFNDLDGVPLEPILKSKHPPHIVVESSPEHFHPYRLVKDIPLDQFKPLQDRLRAEFGGDVMNDLPRVLRLPGFIHRKHRDVPSLVRIISTPYQGPQYTLKDFEIEVKQEDVPDPFENIAHTLHTAARTPAQKINDEALANLSAWVPEVFPDAQAYKEGGYRVSSAALGRSNEEDLSIVSSGIKDFGVHDLGDPKEGKRSPIDVVMEWKLGIPIEKIIQRNNGEAFTEACDWLKERLPSYKGNGQDTTSPLQHTKSRLLQSSKDFVADFQPPDYLIDGLLQRRYVYALTAPTGNGKTCVVLRIAAHIARGIPLGDIEVERGRVLFFAGENPDDVRSRWIMLCEKMELDPDEMDVFFLAGVHPLDNKKIRAQINAEAAEHGPFSLLIVDTSAAFYTGNDENDNVQLGAHARMLRSFVNLPGGPTVLVTCHPTKHPDFENLLPRGGGSFLAEIDGNLVVLKDAAKVNLTVTTHGKFRGPEFMPFHFKLISAQSLQLADSKGRQIWTVFTEPITDEERRTMNQEGVSEQDNLLRTMQANPDCSIAQWAESLSKPTQPWSKSKVYRLLQVLLQAKLVERTRGGEYVITVKGGKEIGGDF